MMAFASGSNLCGGNRNHDGAECSQKAVSHGYSPWIALPEDRIKRPPGSISTWQCREWIIMVRPITKRRANFLVIGQNRLNIRQRRTPGLY
jgi:hypothetical protein